ncbi:hypothetical protein CIRMBP1251_00665 [Enterococcus cecorum]|nr:hypothetical protein CIRMBP1251_00665 [Enterococcus cecorum]CAI3347358.1 hypothetical protein CIRMBP1263_01069 [Enterococcus cecorum]CAI3396480.1 hypothetical protein CIRMBP1291_00882 [Enterococcus cecorum]CAI3432866.1 hypothetical protein CIRMBP1303_01147 [Enterococcus cecorum]CAI3444631.1 hypothetical protein CIRMBP1272_01920 [Enterococcus cecorum]
MAKENQQKKHSTEIQGSFRLESAKRTIRKVFKKIFKF